MDLKLEAKQTQTLSQHMIQSAKILQMTAQELNTYVSDLALENPVIDITEPDAGGRQESIEQQQWLNSFNEENYYLYQRQNNDDDYDFRDSWNIDSTDGETLQDYLWSQLVAENFSEEDTEIIKFMLECLDNKGYLSESVESIAAYFHTDEQRIEALLKLLQELDPAGVCARNLEECLRLQLTRRQLDTPVLLSLVDTCLELVAKNQIPDVTIVKFKDHFDILLNESMYPGIGINSYYRQMSQNPESPEVREYLTTKLRQAEWVKQCIAQRSKTLMQVSRAILAHQEEFFALGPNHLAPLRLADIAGELDIHESTVSRAVSKKYLQCSWGVYPMNYFFSREVSGAKSEGDCSARAMTAQDIKRALREIIEGEEKKKPYSDRILGEKLAERGISISRRTVAKYREEEGIPDASGRKEYL